MAPAEAEEVAAKDAVPVLEEPALAPDVEQEQDPAPDVALVPDGELDEA